MQGNFISRIWARTFVWNCVATQIFFPDEFSSGNFFFPRITSKIENLNFITEFYFVSEDLFMVGISKRKLIS